MLFLLSTSNGMYFAINYFCQMSVYDKQNLLSYLQSILWQNCFNTDTFVIRPFLSMAWLYCHLIGSVVVFSVIAWLYLYLDYYIHMYSCIDHDLFISNYHGIFLSRSFAVNERPYTWSTMHCNTTCCFVDCGSFGRWATHFIDSTPSQSNVSSLYICE